MKAVYLISNSESYSKNRAFKTSARVVFSNTDVARVVDDDFTIMLTEEDAFAGKGNGYTFTRIDGLLLSVYKYTPLCGSFYLLLPRRVLNKKAVINPQNIDQCCFKWSILERHVEGGYRVGSNNFDKKHKYDFSELSFPVSEIKTFEQYNPDESISAYDLERHDSMRQLVCPLASRRQRNHFVRCTSTTRKTRITRNFEFFEIGK